jgi:hypothetical protein
MKKIRSHHEVHEGHEGLVKGRSMLRPTNLDSFFAFFAANFPNPNLLLCDLCG